MRGHAVDDPFHLAAAAYGRGDRADAERLVRALLASEPRHDQALNLAAMLAVDADGPSEAEPLLARALAARPDLAVAHNNHANSLKALGRQRDALAGYDRALKLDPGDVRAWCDRGAVLAALGEFDLALDSYGRAIALRADDADAHYGRAVALHGAGRLADATAGYERVIVLAPERADAHYHLGHARAQLRRHREAVAAYDAALALRPTWDEAHLKRGSALLALDRPGDALAAFTRAIDACATLAGAWQQRGEARRRLGHAADALADHARALALDPALPWARGAALRSALALADWSGLDAGLSALESGIRAGRPVATPRTVITLRDDPALQRHAARLWGGALRVEPLPPIAPRAPGGRLHVGYYAGDLHDPAAAHRLLELIEQHDRTRFEVTALTFGPVRGEPTRRRLEAAFERIVDVREKSDREVAQGSRELGVDVAIDLNGYAPDARPGIFAHRAAPVQVGYGGFPGTLGTPWLDYLLVDRMLIPDLERGHYRERLIRLPRCSLPCGARRPIPGEPLTRREAGLPETGLVYGCFNPTDTLLPPMFAAWMRILGQVPGSVLWLYAAHPTVQERLGREALRRGIGPERLVFAGPLPLARHLARYPLVDLFLDTLPCSDPTTAADALSAGVPVLTQPGRSFAARAAASLVDAAGLKELIATHAEDYEQRAVAVGRDPNRLAALRRRLVANRARATFFDTPGLLACLESAYEAAHARHLAGDAPTDLDVAAP